MSNIYELLESDDELGKELEIISPKSRTKYAYVFLVMKGNDYIPGLISAVESLRQTNNIYDIVCLYTKDVTDSDILNKVCDYTKLVDYIKFSTKPLLLNKQNKLYSCWNDISYTKCQALSLIEYEKVLFMDCDMVVLKNIDHLFELNCPAATFSNPWSERYKTEEFKEKEKKQNVKKVFYDPFNVCYTGDKIYRDDIEEAMHNEGHLFIASLMLLKPSIDDLNQIKNIIAVNQPFGFNNFSTAEEQIISLYYSTYKNVPFEHIHQKYNFIVNKPNWLNDKKNNIPYVLHYACRTKPWLKSKLWFRTPYSVDNIWWYYFYKSCINNNIKNITFPNSKYIFNILYNKDKKHSFYIKYTSSDDKYYPWLKDIKLKQFNKFIN